MNEIDVDDFTNWLRFKRPNEIVGHSCTYGTCPIANFLRERLDAHVVPRVGAMFIKYYDAEQLIDTVVDERLGYPFALPAMAIATRTLTDFEAAFVNEIDLGGPKPITAERALVVATRLLEA